MLPYLTFLLFNIPINNQSLLPTPLAPTNTFGQNSRLSDPEILIQNCFLLFFFPKDNLHSTWILFLTLYKKCRLLSAMCHDTGCGVLQDVLTENMFYFNYSPLVHLFVDLQPPF